ncbi:hypothetical protein [Halioxenophilus sp. WMMB6]|uniref:hypothetical protein n=1 Tax=Halioxenophilus sp. WMMB6 TaxID=3073815 RepID=UPI00295E61ED|nr:hypothetical protein [Halioxenophilus sp. WMMB6]
MTENEYFNAWMAYLAGSVLLTAVWWRISRSWVSWLRYPSLLMVAVALVMPYNIEGGSLMMAPAWLIMMFEGVFLRDIGFARVGPTFATVVGLAALLYPVTVLLAGLIRKALPGKKMEPSPPADPATE